MPPRLKHEEQGGPGLPDFAGVIRNFGDPRDVTGLLRRTTFNMAVAQVARITILHPPTMPAGHGLRDGPG